MLRKEHPSFYPYDMSRPFLLLTFGFVFASLFCSAKVLLPAVFSDHLVLQRNASVTIWGWADPNESVRVLGSWNVSDTVRTKTANDGRWSLKIKTGEAGGPFTLLVEGANSKVVLQDVLIGEVWICSGQSNMEYTANWGLENKDSAIAQADFPGIRFFHVPRVGADYPQQDCKADWEKCTPATMPNNTAVGYYFALALQRKLHVPIGLIEAAWGGTPAEVWVRRDRVEGNPDLVANEYDDHSTGWPVKPGLLYNGMITPVIPYGVAGAIWYQGESNAYRPGAYAVLMDSLVTGWRADFGQDFPFYYVQIAPFTYDSTKQKAFILREQQDLAQRLIPHSGMVVIGDHVADIHNIHPKDKLDVGERLAAYALADTYHDSVGPYQSPSYQSMRIEGRKVYLSFDHAGGGLIADGEPAGAKSPGGPAHFQIAGADGQFVDAKAVIQGNSIIVSAPGVSQPAAVRYCFSNSAVPTVFSKNGHLPLAPFRTDNWKIID
jgi:sialate O-acetylesterase